jgi:hypothetical protein
MGGRKERIESFARLYPGWLGQANVHVPSASRTRSIAVVAERSSFPPWNQRERWAPLLQRLAVRDGGGLTMDTMCRTHGEDLSRFVGILAGEATFRSWHAHCCSVSGGTAVPRPERERAEMELSTVRIIPILTGSAIFRSTLRDTWQQRQES